MNNMAIVAKAAGHGVSISEAFRIWLWLRIALLSFGGPAGQIAMKPDADFKEAPFQTDIRSDDLRDFGVICNPKEFCDVLEVPATLISSANPRDTFVSVQLTELDEFYRVAFRKKLYASIDDLQKDLDLWIRSYNEERPHQGRWCFGKTPLQTFLDGNMKGVGRIYQQTFVDTKVTFAKLYDHKTPITAADLLNDRVVPFFDEKEVKLSRVLTDRGTEYCGNPEHHEYELYLALEDIDHSRTKTKSPQTNGICERFHKTVSDCGDGSVRILPAKAAYGGLRPAEFLRSASLLRSSPLISRQSPLDPCDRQ
jgi:hypothetical protein